MTLFLRRMPALAALADRPVAFLVPACLLAGLLLHGPRQFMTGDEPRYLMYALAFFRHGRFLMSLPEWDVVSRQVAHLPAIALPAGGDGSVLMNGIYLPALLAPVAGLASLPGLRLVTLAAGLGGLFCLWRLLRTLAGRFAALGATAAAGLTVPLLPYLHLFYMETFLFALVCWGWLRLQEDGRGPAGDALTAAILILVPVVHLRGAMVAACLFLLLLHQVVRRGLHVRAMLLGAMGLLAAALFVGTNLMLYGAITGPVNSARPPLPWDWFPVLAMQLFNVHHGLLAYAPLWALAYAGLWFGAWRGVPVVRQALLLAVVAAVTGIGINPGECWPARFWVLSVPMLSVGLCVWLGHARGRWTALCAAVLLAITLANSVMFLRAPNAFLDNRQVSRTYNSLFESTGLFDANLVLPVEIGDARNRTAARNLALGTGLFVLFTLAALRRPGWSAPALLLLLALLDCSRVQRLHHAIASATATPTHLHIVLTTPMREPVLHLGHPEQAWFLDIAWLHVTANGEAGRHETVFGATPLVPVSCRSRVRSLDITSERLDLLAQSAYRLTIDRSTSLLRRLFATDPC